jgi:quaternary ammonium compound-resistance protein SugE
MSWITLIIAGLFEVGFTTCFSKAKDSTGQESVLWWAGFAVCITLSMYLLFRATRDIPMGTAYAVWTGIGAFGTVLIGILFFKEAADFKRIFFLSLLIFSVAGLKVVTND